MWTGNMFQGFSFQVRTLEKHQQANFTVYLADFLRTNVEEFAVRHLCEKEPKTAKRQGFLRPISPKSHQRRKRKGGKKKKNEEEETRRREREKKNQWLHSAFLYWLPWTVFGRKKCLTGEVYLAVTFFQKSGQMSCTVTFESRSDLSQDWGREPLITIGYVCHTVPRVLCFVVCPRSMNTVWRSN